MRGWRLVIAAMATILVVWQMRTWRPPSPLYPIREPGPANSELEADFDRNRCGTISGTVLWSGMMPVVEPIELVQVMNPPGGKSVFPNPLAPRIQNGCLADAVVHLTGIDLRRSRRWDASPTAIEVTRFGLIVKQKGQGGRVAVVRRGEAVELVSHETALHSIRARGAAFFTQMLPVADRPVTRTLPDTGVVELSSGSGYYWLRGYLLISDHPYAAVTKRDGAFEFTQVPVGNYEAVCWVPNWHVDRLENDPEWPGPVRMYFRPAVELRKRVTVKARQNTDLSFSLSESDFAP